MKDERGPRIEERIEYPTNTYAKVKTFAEGEIIIKVDKVWYWNEEPLRIFGNGYKFKMDEEPFKLFETE